MRIVAGILSVGLAALLVAGCSDSPTSTSPSYLNGGTTGAFIGGPQPVRSGAETFGEEEFGATMNGMKVLANTPAVDMRTVASSLYEKGDYAFNSPGHHGTPPERVEQMSRGFNAAVARRVTDSGTAFGLSRESVGL